MKKEEPRARSLSKTIRFQGNGLGKGDIINGLQKQYQNLKSDLDVLHLCRKNLDYESNNYGFWIENLETITEEARRKLTLILDTMIEKIEEECNSYVEQMNTVEEIMLGLHI